MKKNHPGRRPKRLQKDVELRRNEVKDIHTDSKNSTTPDTSITEEVRLPTSKEALSLRLDTVYKEPLDALEVEFAGMLARIKKDTDRILRVSSKER